MQITGDDQTLVYNIRNTTNNIIQITAFIKNLEVNPTPSDFGVGPLEYLQTSNNISAFAYVIANNYCVFDSNQHIVGSFATNSIQFKLQGYTVYLIEGTLKIYSLVGISYLQKNSGSTLNNIPVMFLFFDISSDGLLLVFLLGDKTLNTLTYNSTSSYF